MSDSEGELPNLFDSDDEEESVDDIPGGGGADEPVDADPLLPAQQQGIEPEGQPPSPPPSPIAPRVGNNNWCTCSNCTAMTTAVESVCCTEQIKVAAKMGETCACITLHVGFIPVCLNEEVLQTAYYSYRQQYGDYEGNNWKRYTAYRQFVRWCYKFVGRHNRVPLPSCVVNKIRATFPDEEYTGFINSA